MKNTVRTIEDTITLNARQAESQFDRTRASRTSAIASLLGDIGGDLECEIEAKPSCADEDQMGIEEIFARAEALLASAARKEARA